MTAVTKIDSNSTGLRYSEEASLGVLAGSPVWTPLEPNSYDSFGAEIQTVARRPINDSRQLKKGVVTDKDASGGFETDLTQTNMQDMLQGFFFADFRRKGEETPTDATATTDLFDVADTTGFFVDSLINARGFVDAANNVTAEPVTAVVSNTTVAVTGATLVTETPPADAELVVVGHQFSPNDATAFFITVSGSLPTLTTDLVDFTTLGLVEGEWIYIGGDVADSSFFNSENNGFKRIRDITATVLTFDKSDSAMVADDGSDSGSAGNFDLTIPMYFGRVLKNEAASLITRRSYNFERSLGAPDDASSSDIQAEYMEGMVPGEFSINLPTADKVMCNLSFMGTDSSTIDGPTSLASGTRPSIEEADAFNTSSDFTRIHLATVTDGDEAPAALFAFAQEIEITINNNLTPNKAVGTLGSFEVTAGSFEVSGSITAYFADVAAVESVQANSTITLDFALVKANAGIVMDLPVITLGDGRPNVELDAPITLPLTMAAATGAIYDEDMDYTAMMIFFDYLPDAAAV